MFAAQDGKKVKITDVKVMIVVIGKMMEMGTLIVNLMALPSVYGIAKEFVNLKEKMKTKILLIFVIG